MTSLSGWGRYPRLAGDLSSPRSRSECASLLADPRPLIARGAGRSYGDSALGSRVLATRALDRFCAFDDRTGELTCDAGVTLHDILRLVLPRGWFLPVTPGTRFVTVGGAIASDVHGKNHHAAGSFGMHVHQIEMVLGSSERVRCSPSENTELFHATVGGMGLTGVIVGATLRLQKVPSSVIQQTVLKLPGLEALLAAFEAEASATYSVAWIDCASSGAALGRSLLMLGEHAAEGPLEAPPTRSLSVPCNLPAGLLNTSTARVFNGLHYARAGAGRTTSRVDLHRFFYPLDALASWNRLYGRDGFVQYQFVLPWRAGPAPLREILERIAHSGQASFLGVLKKLGRANAHLLSFPLEGYTLALDFKAEPAVFALLDALDSIVLHHGGRLYLAKDARMSEATFKRSYPAWETFEAVRARWHACGRFASAQSRRLGLA